MSPMLRTLFLFSTVLTVACSSDLQAVDRDGDGFSADEDCWDAPEGPEGSGLSGADFNPEAEDIPYDGFDTDCAGDDDYDLDLDGYVTDEAFVGLATYGVAESGASIGAGDCWDDPATTPDDFVALNGLTQLTAAEVNPGAALDVAYDGIDQDCAGITVECTRSVYDDASGEFSDETVSVETDFDQDGDCYVAAEFDNRAGTAGEDCWDNPDEIPADYLVDASTGQPQPDASDIFPFKGTDTCGDEIDNDCDALIDADDPNAEAVVWFLDADGDTYADPDETLSVLECEAPEGYVGEARAIDCDDSDDVVYPAAEELCDGQYNDCDDGDFDLASAPADELDDDGDTFVECLPEADGKGGIIWVGDPKVTGGDDCDDTSSTTFVNASILELDGLCTKDDDGDAYGDDSPPAGVDAGTDCDDTTNSTYPGAIEIVGDEVDQSCDGQEECYTDADDDGFRPNATDSTFSFGDADCQDSGEAAATEPTTDCDDDDADVYPGAAEVCDGEYNDCNNSDAYTSGVYDDTLAPDDETDNDGDDYVECSGFSSTTWDGDDTTVVGDDDCDDTDVYVFPNATEVCDGQYNDCTDSAAYTSGVYDPTKAPSTEEDDDGDDYVECSGYGVTPWAGISSKTVDVIGDDDCDDTDEYVYPSASEDCDGQYNDCDDPSYSSSSAPSDEEDDDGDNYVECEGYGDIPWAGPFAVVGGEDCDDADQFVYPSADELCDGQWNDCDDSSWSSSGAPDDETDDDGDGDVECTYSSTVWTGTSAVTGGDDCDDDEATIYVGATELCDGQINNCSTSSLPTNETDDDGDGDVECSWDSGGWDGTSAVTGDDDCDDTDETLYVGATELCDGQINNCSSSALPSDETDDDGDGDVECTFDSGGWDGTSAVTGDDDCDDTDATLYVGATELCDGQINNCSTSSLPTNETDDDGDGDVECSWDSGGWDGTSAVTGDDDCDDTDATLYVGATELCDGQINNCSSSALPSNETDDDGDGAVECTFDSGGWDGTGAVTADEDCDDAEATIYDGATELCDGQINNCSTSSLPSDEVDNDSDGDVECTFDSGGWDGTGSVTGDEDCDDTDATINDGATELCDGQINNCSTSSLPSDEVDNDSDGAVECTFDSGGWDGTGSVTADEDCDDTDGTIYDGATEICDGQINDCSTSSLPSDEVDNDGDGYVECTFDSGGWDGTGSVSSDEDCDDTDDTIYPSADELCDGQINDCDTSSLPSNEVDNDGDGDVECTFDSDGWDGTGSVTGDEDCDDTDGTIYVGATEICDGQINDCDTSSLPSDEVDNDSDGAVECTFDSGGWDGTGSVTADEDCDDTDDTIYDGATELCDGQINDCSTSSLPADEVDNDSDGAVECTWDAGGWDGTGSVVDDDDCDDTDSGIYPTAAEDCSNGIDDDCDGDVDEDDDECYLDVSELVAGDLVITEFMVDSNVVSDLNGEWFEIYNDSGSLVDLDGLVVYDNAGDFTASAGSFITSSKFDDGEYMLFCINATSADNGGITNCDYDYSGIAFSNSGGDELYLYYEGTSSSLEIDGVDFTGWSFSTGASLSLSSVGSVFDATNNDDEVNWCDGTVSYGSSGNDGSPGTANTETCGL